MNKEALRNSARAVIDQCKGIMAERRAERRHKELIDIASQPVKPVDFDDGFIFFVFIANGK